MPAKRSPLLLVLASLTALAVAMGVGRFAFTPMLPLMQADSGLSLPGASALAFANYLGYLLGALYAARTSTPAGRLLHGGLILVVLTTGLMGASTRFGVWLALRLVAGIASAWVLVATSSLSMARLSELGRATLSGLPFAGVGAGITGAGLLCAVVAGSGVSSYLGWYGLAGAALLGSIFVWCGLRPALQSTPSAGPVPAAPAGHGVLVACYGLAGFGYSLPATFLPAQARALLASPALFGWVWPVFGLAALASTLICCLLGNGLPRRRLWAGAQAVMAVGVLLPQWGGGLGIMLVAAVCVGGTFMVITMLGMQEARAVAGGASHTLMAHMTAAFALGQLLGPLLVGATAANGMSSAAVVWLAGGGLIASSLVLGRQPRAAA
jgi:predicted MFS family arabinose efflux permease